MTGVAPATIASRYKLCAETFDLLRRVLEHAQPRFLEQMPLLEVQTELGRLRVWAGNLAAHREGRMSLDHRLRQAGHLRQRTIDLLDRLHRNLCDSLAIIQNERLPYDELSSSSDSSGSSSGADEMDLPSELDEILDDVKRTISYLYELAILVRNPTPTDRFRRANDIDTSHFEEWDVNHVREKFPLLATVSPFLLERLGKANSRRRQVFKYNKLHNSKLKRGVDALVSRAEPAVVIAVTEPENQQEIFRSENWQDQDAVIRNAPSTRATTMDTQTTVTTFVENRTDYTDIDVDDGLSETSSAVSENPVDEGALSIPEPPADALDGKHFQCPYCYDISKTPKMSQWKKHIYQDLQPYTCTFESCSHPNKTYGSREEWFEHEARIHRMKWACPECQQNFTSKSGFVDHRQHQHSASVDVQQLPALLEMCSRPEDTNCIGQCSLCFKEGQPLRRHMAHHMLSLALFALPRRDDDATETGESNEGQAGASEGDSSMDERRGALSLSDSTAEIPEDAKIVPDDPELEGRKPEFDNVAETGVVEASSENEPVAEAPISDLWDRAYQISRRSDSWPPYEEFLIQELNRSSSVDAITALDEIPRKDMMWTLVMNKTEIITEPEWYLMYTRELPQIEKAVLFVRHIISSGETDQHSALAWAGVSLLLPLIFNASVDVNVKELPDEGSVAEALEYMCTLIGYLTHTQRIYIEQNANPALSELENITQLKSAFESHMTNICSQLLKCQAVAVYQLIKLKVPAHKISLPSLFSDLRKAHAACQSIFGIIDPVKLTDSLRQQDILMEKLFRLQETVRQGPEDSEARVNETLRARATRQEEESLKACLDVLCTTDYEIGKDRIPKPVPGTCQWILQHPTYRDWAEKKSSDFLRIQGIVGTGKSVLLRSLVDGDLQSTGLITTCYYFFSNDDPDGRSASKAMSALIHQICRQNRALLRKANEIVDLNGRKVTHSFSWLWHLLISLAQCPESDGIVCLLDAFDECEGAGRIDLVASLHNLHSNNDVPKGKLRFLVTSCGEEGIETVPGIKILDLFDEQLEVAMRQDIDIVTRARVAEIAAEKALNNATQEVIHSTFKSMNPTYRSHHLWHRLALSAIENAPELDSPRHMAAFVKRLTQHLNDVCEELLQLSPRPQDVAKLLDIVVAAARPLTLPEMKVAMSIGEGQKSHKTDLPTDQEFLSMIKGCGGSLFHTCHNKVLLIHQHTKSWWEHRKNGTTTPHYTLVDICLTYLSFDEFESYPPPTDPYEEGKRQGSREEYADRQRQIFRYAQQYDLLEYAAIHWTHHFRSTRKWDVELLERWESVCQPQSMRFYTWFRIFWYGHNMQNNLQSLMTIPTFNLLSLAVFLGHESMVMRLIGREEDFEPKRGQCWPPLLTAIYRGDTTMATFLVKRGAALNSEGIEDWTPLGLAASKGLQVLTEDLIKHGASVGQKTHPRGYTSLERAASAGQLAIVEILLDNGAAVNDTNNSGETALMSAAWKGRKEIAELLLDRGADIQACANDDWTPLHYAVHNGHENLAELLLEKGALPDTKTITGKTPLSSAARGGLVRLTKVLIVKGAELDSQDDEGRTPLMYATRAGHGSIAKELIKAGSDVNISDENGRTALLHAVQRNNRTMTEMLLEAGADPNEGDEDGKTPLIYALPLLPDRGLDHNAGILLDHGADVDKTDNEGRTALSHAAERSPISAMQLLLDTEANPDIVDQEHQAPMHYAAYRNSDPEATVKLLIEASADYTLRDLKGNTPLDIVRQRRKLGALKNIEDAISRHKSSQSADAKV